jgi:hypothetical protein
MITKIRQLLFGVRRAPVDTFIDGFTTLIPTNQPPEDDWMKEFRVSMLYDRKIVHL